jgi:hypothetical protein
MHSFNIVTNLGRGKLGLNMLNSAIHFIECLVICNKIINMLLG